MKHYGRKSDLAARVMVVSILVLMTGVAGYVGASIYNMPEKVTVREAESLAREYYEYHFWAEFVNSSQGKTLEEMFEPYAERGFEPVYLRQLILFDEVAHPEAAEIFSGEKYRCNTNSSKVVFRPVAPYGRTDYELELELSCKGR